MTNRITITGDEAKRLTEEYLADHESPDNDPGPGDSPHTSPPA